jgi:ComF family protein
LTAVELWRSAGWQLAPARCLLCGAPGADRLDLCVHCIARLPASTVPWRPGEDHIGWQLAPWRYAHPVDAMVRQLKFHGERSYARALGTLLARQRRACPEPLPDLIVPMPLHPRRLRARGYNQAAEIACFAGRELQRPRSQALRRTRDTAEQSALPRRQRRLNVHGAFAGTRGLTGLRVALIDDVVTTGSTARAAAAALHRAGAASIEVWALAVVEQISY